MPSEPDPCDPVTATLTIESTSYGTTTTQGTVRTTATSTLSQDFPIVGCSVEASSTATTTTGCAASATGPGAPACSDPPPVIVDSVVFLRDMFADTSALKAKLSADSQPNAQDGKKLDSFNVIEAPALGFTAFIYLTRVQENYINSLLNFGVSAPFVSR
jgi:hypothetical protein